MKIWPIAALAIRQSVRHRAAWRIILAYAVAMPLLGEAMYYR